MHLSGRTEENHNKPESQQLVSGLRFEPGTPNKQSRSATCLTMFGVTFCNISYLNYHVKTGSKLTHYENVLLCFNMVLFVKSITYKRP